MLNQFLHEQLNIAFDYGVPKPEMPGSITQNLNPTYELRDYQKDAFASFIHYFNNDLPGKEKPIHLLFNMATGSGKTLIMAGLILYLYEKGYRNFLFFVNSTNIIEKTKDNFLNPRAAKYLFSQDVRFEGKPVTVTQVDNFDGVNENDINICFTTIQQLHMDMTSEKENALTYENFAEQHIVLLADEAHHMNVSTKSQQGMELFESWENTVERIFKSNDANLLLEFTATHDYETPTMVEKYRNKVINRYDLINFRNDKFSKEVVLVHSDLDQDSRILQALILNQYKQEVAAKSGISLKPVILFKAQKTIAQSEENKENFHKLIDGLTGDEIKDIWKSPLEIVKRAFRFFDENKISADDLAQRLKSEFQEAYCLSVNDENEKKNYQMQVNTLEDKDNPIRAIFAVQKLNEGWDVLNLFDIVRCYEARDSGKNRIGKTTISEAQLIGRGARYFPFIFQDHSDRFRRKFDEALNHELRVLEELHYHSIHDSRYISEIRTALIEQGMMDERMVNRELKLKDKFKKTDFYKYGVIYLNDQVPKDYQHVQSFDDLANLSVKQRNYEYTIHTGSAGETTVMKEDTTPMQQNGDGRDIPVIDIEQNILRSAIARNPFFTFASLKRYCPHLTSVREFMTSEDYLGGLVITFKGNLSHLEKNRPAKLSACQGLLNRIETEIREQVTEYQGTKHFQPKQVHDVFKDKLLKFDARNSLATIDRQFENEDWFPFNTLYGTSEEKAFVDLLIRKIKDLAADYDEIYLLRNEMHFAIYNFSDGQAFYPDFALFLQEKKGELVCFQFFVEPKGKFLQQTDRWKENFMRDVTTEFKDKLLTFDSKEFRLIGLPFYNEENENPFWDALTDALTQTA
ncbi:MAG: DEAD/DEAH box helicase family protein [Candidatus Poribacteria bacterium]|nr:DEAD/DEAH box helicase family protein [Candidatus Poribacteria bacterium]